jgi:hypothetical protein
MSLHIIIKNLLIVGIVLFFGLLIWKEIQRKGLIKLDKKRHNQNYDRINYLKDRIKQKKEEKAREEEIAKLERELEELK